MIIKQLAYCVTEKTQNPNASENTDWKNKNITNKHLIT